MRRDTSFHETKSKVFYTIQSIFCRATADCRFQKLVGVPDTPENRAKFISNVPLGRLGEVEDVANAALFLASDEGAFITGVNMEVDGGRAV